MNQCWSANVKVPKALLSEARATFEANPDGGLMITTGSIAVSTVPYSLFFFISFSLCLQYFQAAYKFEHDRAYPKAAPACLTR
jgi:hypothetical protein